MNHDLGLPEAIDVYVGGENRVRLIDAFVEALHPAHSTATVSFLKGLSAQAITPRYCSNAISIRFSRRSYRTTRNDLEPDCENGCQRAPAEPCSSASANQDRSLAQPGGFGPNPYRQAGRDKTAKMDSRIAVSLSGLNNLGLCR